MIQILRHGETDGFVLLDALVALFITGIAVITVCATLSFLTRFSAIHLERAGKDLEKRNSIAKQFMQLNE